MKSVHVESQALGEFLDWLRISKGFVIAEYHAHADDCFAPDDEDREEPICGFDAERPYPVNLSVERLLAEYYEIDLNKAEEERLAVLEDFRARHP